jgi:hypothetical protein
LQTSLSTIIDTRQVSRAGTSETATDRAAIDAPGHSAIDRESALALFAKSSGSRAPRRARDRRMAGRVEPVQK